MRFAYIVMQVVKVHRSDLDAVGVFSRFRSEVQFPWAGSHCTQLWIVPGWSILGFVAKATFMKLECFMAFCFFGVFPKRLQAEAINDPVTGNPCL